MGITLSAGSALPYMIAPPALINIGFGATYRIGPGWGCVTSGYSVVIPGPHDVTLIRFGSSRVSPEFRSRVSPEFQ